MRSMFLCSLVFFTVAQANEAEIKYIEMSLHMVAMFRGTTVEEGSIHQLCKDLVAVQNDEEETHRVLDEYMEGLNEGQQKDFARLYYDEVKLHYVTNKINKLLSLHLNEDQIKRLRNVLMASEQFEASRDDMILALIEELSQDSSVDEAQKKIESVFQDLRVLNKKNPGWMEKVEKSLHKVANFAHDEM